MFKQRFKYFKSKKPPPELSDVVSFEDLEEDMINKFDIVGGEKTFFGLKLPEQWKVYELKNHPGLLFIKNPFTILGQRYWIARSLKDYPRKPNKTNLDVFDVLPVNENWWEFCHKGQTPSKLLDKLRWVTFGYHHDWNTKIYIEDSYSEFPAELEALCDYVAGCLGFSGFKSEAAIVNYYHMDSTLSGHTDHSEENLDAPLFSFSFGQTAIFLLGGKTVEDDATAMYLKSGDIIVMSKDSRLCYHGVPKILKADLCFWDNSVNEIPGDVPELFKDALPYCMEPTSWKYFSSYMAHSRININVRQVLKSRHTQLGNNANR